MYALLADCLTLSRVFASGILAWLGLAYGREKLTVAALILLVAWTTDQLDGWAARRSKTPTRLGHYDFVFDLTLYPGILIYLVAAGFVPVGPVVAFVILSLVAWLPTRRKAVAVLCIRFVDLTTAVVLLTYQPRIGLLMLAWLAALGVIYRRRLAERVPRWFRELSQVAHGRRKA